MPPLPTSHLRVREYETHFRRPGGKQQGPHRRGLSHANRADVRPDILHRVVDRQPGRDYSARADDVTRKVERLEK